MQNPWASIFPFVKLSLTCRGAHFLLPMSIISIWGSFSLCLYPLVRLWPNHLNLRLWTMTDKSWKSLVTGQFRAGPRTIFNQRSSEHSGGRRGLECCSVFYWNADSWEQVGYPATCSYREPENKANTGRKMEMGGYRVLGMLSESHHQEPTLCLDLPVC